MLSSHLNGVECILKVIIRGAGWGGGGPEFGIQ